MRKIFFKTLEDIARKDKSIFLLVADLGIKFFESFRSVDKERAINVGVAEANMVGVAAGLSLLGKNVYCYSIIPFIALRALEQIKVDIAFNNLNVKLLGAGGGLVYGVEGITHHSIEDIAIMRAIPNMTVVCPGDAKEVECLAKESVSFKGPMYIRFGRDSECLIHKGEIDFKIGKGIIINEGKDICLIATGTMLNCASQVVEALKEKGLNPTLISMHTIKPMDVDLVKQCAKKYSSIFTLEEHSIIGGLGGAAAEILAESGYSGKFKRIGIIDKYSHDIGGPSYLLEKAGLDAKSVTDKILKELELK